MTVISHGLRRATARLAKIRVRSGCWVASYDEHSAMRDRFHWARLLSFLTGLVNQELLLRNEYIPGCAGLNRHGSEDERALRERSSNPLGPEFCTGRCEMSSEA